MPSLGEYETSHRHPINRSLHLVGVPMIVVSLALFPAGVFAQRLLIPAIVLFAVGWLLQLVGHAIEGKRPAFTRDSRFLFMGLVWWWREVRALFGAQR